MSNSYHLAHRTGDRPIHYNQDISHVNNSFHNNHPSLKDSITPSKELHMLMMGEQPITETNASFAKRSKSGISQRTDIPREIFSLDSPVKNKRSIGIIRNSRERERHDNLTKISQQIISSPEPSAKNQLPSSFTISKRPAHSGPGLNIDNAYPIQYNNNQIQAMGHSQQQ